MEAVEGRLSKLQHKDDSRQLDLDIKAEELRTDLRRDYIFFTDNIRSQLDGLEQAGNTTINPQHQQEIHDLKAAHLSSRDVLDERWNQLSEEIQMRDEHIRLLHGKLQVQVMESFKEVEKQFREVVTTKVTSVRSELKAEIKGLAKAWDAKRES